MTADVHTHTCPFCYAVRDCAEPECRESDYCPAHLDLLALVAVMDMEQQFEQKRTHAEHQRRLPE